MHHAKVSNFAQTLLAARANFCSHYSTLGYDLVPTGWRESRMRESKQSAGARELLAHLEAENSMLRDRALKLASEIRALREALGGDVPSENTPAQHRRQGESVVVTLAGWRASPNPIPRHLGLDGPDPPSGPSTFRKLPFGTGR